MDIKGASCDQAFSSVHGGGSGHESPTMKRRRYSSSASNDGSPYPPDSQYMPVDVCGNLHKQGKLLKTWKQRYFEIQGNFMYYYKNDQKKQYLGCIDLQKCYYVGPSSAATFGAAFELQTLGRTHLLAARNQQAVSQWVSVIKGKMLPEAKAHTKPGSRADISAYAGNYSRRATIKASRGERKAPLGNLHSVRESSSSHQISKTTTKLTNESKLAASQSFPEISQEIMVEQEEPTEDVFEKKESLPPTTSHSTESTDYKHTMETISPSTSEHKQTPHDQSITTEVLDPLPVLNIDIPPVLDNDTSSDASLPSADPVKHVSLKDAHQLSTSLAIVEEDTTIPIQDTSIVSFDDVPLITETPPAEPRAAFIKRLSLTMISPPNGTAETEIAPPTVQKTSPLLDKSSPHNIRGSPNSSSSSTTSLSPSNRGYGSHSSDSYVERLREILAHDDINDSDLSSLYDELPPMNTSWEAQTTSVEQLRVFLRVCA